jgi:hypothetical protein
MTQFKGSPSKGANLPFDEISDSNLKKLQTLSRLASAAEPELLKLPHPARTAYMKLVEISELTYGPEWPAVSTVLADHTLTLFETVTLLKDISPVFRALYYMTGNHATGTNGGNSGNNVLSLRFMLARGHVFQTTDVLDQQLQVTDIASTIPVSLIRAPYPVSYFEFGQSRQSPFTVFNQVTGDHAAEGCYLFECRSDTLMGEKRPEYRVLTLMLTGSPKADISDDATQIYTIPILDEDLTISETITQFMRLHRQDIAQARTSNAGVILKESSDEEAAALELVLQHVMKIMLYISTAKAVTQPVNELSAALKKANSAPAGLMREKQKQKAQRLYDRIVIGPKEMPKEEGDKAAGSTGRHVTPHWRRGHFREQRHGEGRQQVKTIFIEPMRIAFENIANPSAPPKTYVIKES